LRLFAFGATRESFAYLARVARGISQNPMSASPAKIAARLLSRYAKVGIKLMQPFTAKEAALPTRWLRQPSASQLDQKEQGRIGYSHFVLVQGEEIQ